MKLNIGVIGCGFVGEAIINGIEELLSKYNTQLPLIEEINRYVGRDAIEYHIFKYDPIKYPESLISDLMECELVFVCVPTPMHVGGKMDDSFLRDVFNKLRDINYKGVCVIKSTTVPTVITDLMNSYRELRIVTNPEFLTERVAKQDFINTKWVILGGKLEDCEVVYILSSIMWPNAKYSFVSAEGAMMVKYMCNVWFATKVSLMNEFYTLHKAMGFTDWNNIIEALKTDDRVGPTHLQVPGPDGHFGWGGKCFKKDLGALTYLAKQFLTVHNVMDGTDKTNDIVRENKDWLRIDNAVTQEYKVTNNEGK